MELFEPIIDDFNQPLVSVLVYNYNYGRYLEACLNSVIQQSYKNIEIVFSDNASTDSSWEIAMDFVARYPGKMTVVRNARNLGPGENYHNCVKVMRGNYCVVLGSDDMLMPTFVEQCVNVFRKNAHIAFVMTHCAVIDAEGNRQDDPPFYNQSCVINGQDQAAVYMMAAVNPSISQIMYDRLKMQHTERMIGAFASRWYGMRILDFNLCTQYPMAYIKDPLLLFRIHGQNDSLSASEDLLEVMGPYILVRQFYEAAKIVNFQKVIERLPAAVEKLALLSLRYCIRHLNSGNPRTAKRYFHLAPSLNPDVTEDTTYLKLEQYWRADEQQQGVILADLCDVNNLVTRSVSYDPPQGSVAL